MEWVRQRVNAGARYITLAGATSADIRDIIVDGESGLLACFPPWQRPRYQPSMSRVTFHTGARALLASADEPDRFRGKQSDTVVADELAAYRYPEAWTQMMLGLRLGDDYGIKPRAIVTTTPRPTEIIRSLIKNPNTVTVRGSTYENEANLSAAFISQIATQYEGTRLGRQELYAEILEDYPGALWNRAMIDRTRVQPHEVPELVRGVVAIDPSVTANENSDECGIVVVARDERGHGYVLEDLTVRASPNAWAKIAVAAHHRWRTDRIVAETNNGGDMVEQNLRTVDPHIPYRGVHASRGKRARAEPISSFYERGIIHHRGIDGLLKLEDEMCTWDPTTSNASPNRIDALVWGLTDLLLVPQYAPRDLGNIRI
jgi:phage terminase large subunit-like protein